MCKMRNMVKIKRCEFPRLNLSMFNPNLIFCEHFYVYTKTNDNFEHSIQACFTCSHFFYWLKRSKESGYDTNHVTEIYLWFFHLQLLQAGYWVIFFSSYYYYIWSNFNIKYSPNYLYIFLKFSNTWCFAFYLAGGEGIFIFNYLSQLNLSSLYLFSNRSFVLWGIPVLAVFLGKCRFR